MSVTFDVAPEKHAGMLSSMRRQLFETPATVTRNDVDLEGKTALVTGANQGIGLEVCRQLLGLGLSKLIIGVRNEAAGQTAASALIKEQKLDPEVVEVWKIDMLSYDSVTIFAQRASQLERLDIAVLNAGIFRKEMQINESTRHEEDVQTNYLSTVLLLILLLPAVRAKNSATSPGHITITSSDMAGMTKFEEQDADPLLPALDDKSANWNFGERYGTSKLLGQFFVTQLAKQVPPSSAIVNLACPGLCYGSGLGRDTKGTALQIPLVIYLRILGRSPAVGARVLVNAVTKQGEASHGQNIDTCKIRPMAPIVYTPKGEEIAQRLWDETLNELSFADVQEIILQLADKKV